MKRFVDCYSNIKKLRISHKYTQKFVANYIGISQRNYSHYENGEYELTASLAIRLASLYNVSVDSILEVNNRVDAYKKYRYYHN